MAKAPQYGTTRTGQQLDASDFALGGSAQYTRELRNRANNAAEAGQAAQKQTAGRVGVVGNQIGGAASTAAERSAAAGDRATPTTDYGASSAAVGANRINAADQRGIAQRLQDFADGPAPESAAQAQLQQGTNAALEAGLSLARSGGGFGESAASLGQAGRNATSTIANAGAESARLRAQEDQAWREQQLSALGQAGDIYAGARSADLAEAGLLGGQAEFLTDAELRDRQIDDATALGWAGVQQDAYGQQLNALGMESGMQDIATGYDFDALGLDLASEQAALEGRVSREEINQANYAAELQHQLGARELDQSKDKDIFGTALGAASTLGAAAMMFSDERGKKKIRKVDDLSETYAALGGTATGDAGSGSAAGASVRSGAREAPARLARAETKAKNEQAANSLFSGIAQLAGALKQDKPKRFVRY